MISYQEQQLYYQQLIQMLQQQQLATQLQQGPYSIYQSVPFVPNFALNWMNQLSGIQYPQGQYIYGAPPFGMQMAVGGGIVSGVSALGHAVPGMLVNLGMLQHMLGGTSLLDPFMWVTDAAGFGMRKALGVGPGVGALSGLWQAIQAGKYGTAVGAIGAGLMTSLPVLGGLFAIGDAMHRVTDWTVEGMRETLQMQMLLTAFGNRFNLPFFRSEDRRLFFGPRQAYQMHEFVMEEIYGHRRTMLNDWFSPDREEILRNIALTPEQIENLIAFGMQRGWYRQARDIGTIQGLTRAYTGEIQNIARLLGTTFETGTQIYEQLRQVTGYITPGRIQPIVGNIVGNAIAGGLDPNALLNVLTNAVREGVVRGISDKDNELSLKRVGQVSALGGAILRGALPEDYFRRFTGISGPQSAEAALPYFQQFEYLATSGITGRLLSMGFGPGTNLAGVPSPDLFGLIGTARGRMSSRDQIIDWMLRGHERMQTWAAQHPLEAPGWAITTWKEAFRRALPRASEDLISLLIKRRFGVEEWQQRKFEEMYVQFPQLEAEQEVNASQAAAEQLQRAIEAERTGLATLTRYLERAYLQPIIRPFKEFGADIQTKLNAWANEQIRNKFLSLANQGGPLYELVWGSQAIIPGLMPQEQLQLRAQMDQLLYGRISPEEFLASLPENYELAPLGLRDIPGPQIVQPGLFTQIGWSLLGLGLGGYLTRGITGPIFGIFSPVINAALKTARSAYAMQQLWTQPIGLGTTLLFNLDRIGRLTRAFPLMAAQRFISGNIRAGLPFFIGELVGHGAQKYLGELFDFEPNPYVTTVAGTIFADLYMGRRFASMLANPETSLVAGHSRLFGYGLGLAGSLAGGLIGYALAPTESDEAIYTNIGAGLGFGLGEIGALGLGSFKRAWGLASSGEKALAIASKAGEVSGLITRPLSLLSKLVAPTKMNLIAMGASFALDQVLAGIAVHELNSSAEANEEIVKRLEARGIYPKRISFHKLIEEGGIPAEKISFGRVSLGTFASFGGLVPELDAEVLGYSREDIERLQNLPKIELLGKEVLIQGLSLTSNTYGGLSIYEPWINKMKLTSLNDIKTLLNILRDKLDKGEMRVDNQVYSLIDAREIVANYLDRANATIEAQRNLLNPYIQKMSEINAILGSAGLQTISTPTLTNAYKQLTEAPLSKPQLEAALRETGLSFPETVGTLYDATSYTRANLMLGSNRFVAQASRIAEYFRRLNILHGERRKEFYLTQIMGIEDPMVIDAFKRGKYEEQDTLLRKYISEQFPQLNLSGEQISRLHDVIIEKRKQTKDDAELLAKIRTAVAVQQEEKKKQETKNAMNDLIEKLKNEFAPALAERLATVIKGQPPPKEQKQSNSSPEQGGKDYGVLGPQ